MRSCCPIVVLSLLASHCAPLVVPARAADGPSIVEQADKRIYAPPRDLTSADQMREEASLPPLPPDVSEIRFHEVYELPVGPGGLEFSGKARSLANQRVRVLGYMVHEDLPIDGRILLSPFPLRLFTAEYGLSEDLPPTVIHVGMPGDDRRKRMHYTPGLLLLTGVLEIGPHEEPDGRISHVRLLLDAPETLVASDQAASRTEGAPEG